MQTAVVGSNALDDLVVFRATHNRLLRAFAVLMPAAMAFAVVATANHFVLGIDGDRDARGRLRRPAHPRSRVMAAVEQRPYRARHSARVWRWTVGSGVALVALAAVHTIAQHFVVDDTGGLRTYDQVVDYIANPVIFTVECGFLLAVTIHALLGLRGILLDLDPGPRTRRRIDAGLWVLGTVTVAWGLTLLTTLAARS